MRSVFAGCIQSRTTRRLCGAEKLWRKAAQSPCSTLRRIWAEHRAEFCANAHLKGWRPRHECEEL
ncbi:ANR family transcriptional regulator [Escherichia coli]|uniref:ANR family transcriptional regulator n=1 Tax=Escherichia coli TaxID=562 RepID=UPI002FCD0FF3